MYKVISIALTLLWTASVVLSFLGIIVYPPAALMASAVILFVSVYGTSWLFGRLFNVRTHSESSFITAFILFFIFTPTIEVAGLLILMLTGMLAAASKFLLVYNGRHIFNPAAAAAVIIGLTGLGFASWWVATPPLMPLTLLLGLLILYKTRRRQIGFVFLAVTVSLVMLSLLSEGNSVSESLALLSSWPFVFFACFMLTEPLTLPGKRWQQFIEVIVVAVLFALPVHLGDFTSTPAMALLIGNLIGFSFNRRPAMALQLREKKELTPTTTEFSFKLNAPIAFEAGQYIEMTIPHASADFRGTRRVFSITSAPTDTSLRIASKFYQPSSTFKHTLASLPTGATIQATSIGGDFTLPKDPTQPLLFIAGGIGITPYISHLRYLQSQNQTRDIVLIYAISSFSELAFQDVLADSDIKIIVASKEKVPHLLKQWTHVETNRVTPNLVANHVPDITKRAVYISGPPEMVNEVRKTVAGLHAKSVTCDYFIGY